MNIPIQKNNKRIQGILQLSGFEYNFSYMLYTSLQQAKESTVSNTNIFW